MTRTFGVPMPPAIEGIPTPGPGDAARIVTWSQRGHRHGITHGRPLGRVVSLVMWGANAALRPLMTAHYRRMLTRPDTHFYGSPEQDCVLGVQATPTGWALVDHIAAHPGRGSGHQLRAAVLPALVTAADAGGVAISIAAVNQKMVTAYTADLPGLLPIGRAFPHGRRLRREPLPAIEGAPTSRAQVS